MYPGTRPLCGNQIRLLRLLPGGWEDDICCELVYTALGDAPSYQALSYVWGSPKETRSILLDGKGFAVTINLESTLRHIRCQTENPYLWVDALCINQADDQEKTHQVNLMGSIYQSSKSVIAYLGNSINQSNGNRGSKEKTKSFRSFKIRQG